MDNYFLLPVLLVSVPWSYCQIQCLEYFLLFSSSFIVLICKFWSFIHFKFTFVCKARKGLASLFLHVGIQLSQHHLLDFFLIEWSWHLCKTSLDSTCNNLFLGLLCYVFLYPTMIYFSINSFVVWKSRKCESCNFFFLEMFWLFGTLCNFILNLSIDFL